MMRLVAVGPGQREQGIVQGLLLDMEPAWHQSKPEMTPSHRESRSRVEFVILFHFGFKWNAFLLKKEISQHNTTVTFARNVTFATVLDTFAISTPFQVGVLKMYGTEMYRICR